MTHPPFRHPATLVCAVLSFGLGLFLPLSPSEGSRLPETVMEPPRLASPHIDPWNSYYRMMTELEDRYYGDLPAKMRLTHAAIRGLLRTVDDPFTRFLDPGEYERASSENRGDFVGIGAYLDDTTSSKGYVIIRRTVPKGPADKAGVRVNDRVLRVDNRSVKGIKTEQLSKLVRGAPRTTVRLTIRRPGQKSLLVKSILRDRVEYEVVEHQMKPGNIGYIRISLFNNHADAQLARAVQSLTSQGMKALILDLRGNPGGMLESAVAIVSRFVPPGNNAVITVESGGKRHEQPVNGRKHLKLQVPFVVLVDGESASAAEIVAGGIKDNRVGTLIGETTYGKGLVQTVIELPGSAAVAITSAKYLTSKGHDINRTRTSRGGVEPDIAVKLTPKDLIAGKDPQLDQAMRHLRDQLNARARSRAPGEAIPGTTRPAGSG